MTGTIDALEIIKIILIMIVGYMIIKALIYTEMDYSDTECLCNCIKGGMICLK